MNTCNTCDYWIEPSEGEFYTEKVRGRRKRVPFVFGECMLLRVGDSASLQVTEANAILSGPNFGCNQHKPLDKWVSHCAAVLTSSIAEDIPALASLLRLKEA